MKEKLKRLRERVRGIGSAVVAFSSGVDSTFLLHVAHEELGERVVAATIRSHTFPKRELDEAAAFCRAEGVRHVVIESEELDVPGFVENPPDRCYHCKRELFSKLLAFARENGLPAVLEGSNLDDDGDYRPGRRAIQELGIVSPLHEVGLTKDEIRALSREMGLPTSDKPSFACLASRFPYGERITAACVKAAREATANGADRIGIVTSGRCLSREDVDNVCEALKAMRQATDIGLCATHTTADKLATLRAAKRLGFQVCCGDILGMGETDEQLVEFAFALQEIAPDSIPVNVLHPIEGTPLHERGVLDPERVVDSVAILRLVNPSTPLRFAGGRRDMSDETAAKCIYVGMSAGIAGPLLTTPGADFDDDRELALRAGYAVGSKAFPS